MEWLKREHRIEMGVGLTVDSSKTRSGAEEKWRCGCVSLVDSADIWGGEGHQRSVICSGRLCLIIGAPTGEREKEREWRVLTSYDSLPLTTAVNVADLSFFSLRYVIFGAVKYDMSSARTARSLEAPGQWRYPVKGANRKKS